MQTIRQCHRPFLPPDGVEIRGTVHSVFPNTCNILLENAQLITLSPMERGRGPAAFLPADGVPGGLSVGQSVTLHAKELCIGELHFPIEEHAPYDLPRGCFSAERTALDRLIPRLREKIEAAIAERTPDTPFYRGIADHLAAGLDALKRHFIAGDRNRAIEAGRGLIGLGMGLTPSGDDILTGMFFVLGLDGSPFPAGDSLLGEMLRGCEENTTDVSRQMLSAAAEGYYKEILTDLADAFSANDTALDAAADAVLSVGHSSGADMLTGVLAGLEILQGAFNNTGG